MKKVLSVILFLMLALSVLLVTACKPPQDQNSGDSGSAGQGAYVISVATLGGTPVKGVTVEVLQAGEKVKSATTAADGKVKFNLTDGDYTARAINLPEGYSNIDGAEYNLSASEKEVTIYLQTAVIEGQAPEGKLYALGDVMYDFTLTECETGETLTLSNLFETKNTVVLNFWATYCGPCASEFPAMQKAYEMYKDDLEIIAISAYDNKSACATYKAEKKITFSVASDTANLFGLFGVGSIPHTIVIDRYGVIAYSEIGSQDLDAFVNLFRKFTSADYEQDIEIKDPTQGDGEQAPELTKPTTKMPQSSAIQAAINANGAKVTYSITSPNYEDDEYTWPWVISDDGKTLYASNKGVDYSYAIVYMTAQLNAGQALAFDYKYSMEEGYEEFYVKVDDIMYGSYTGESDWKTCYPFVAEKSGEYEIALTYIKDEGKSVGDDTVYIKNVRVIDKGAIDAETNIRRWAATEKATDGQTQYTNYITPVLNSQDGFYHVGSENGPLLMADLTYITPWRDDASIYAYANSGLIVDASDGMNYSQSMLDFCNFAVHSDTERCPVDEELKELLIIAMNAVGSGYENEWLEVCTYYDHYGPTNDTLIVNPVAGISYRYAIPVNGDFHVSITKGIIPRGMKYLYVPQKTGVYNIYSVDDEDKDDTFLWIFEKTIYGEYVLIEETDGQFYDVGNYNFNSYIYLEKGKEYYLVCDMFMPMTMAEYDVKIDYLGDSYTHFTNAATGPYTYTETGNVYVLNSIRAELCSDGYYHEIRNDGSVGAIVLIDLVNGSPFMPNLALKNVIAAKDSAGEYYYYFDFTNIMVDNKPGKDYTDAMYDYVDKMDDDGFVKADAQLVEILNIFTKVYGFENAEGAWLMFGYYDKYIGAKGTEPVYEGITVIK